MSEYGFITERRFFQICLLCASVYLCLVVTCWERADLLALVCVFICALWSPAGKELTFWLLFVVSNCEVVFFPISILGQVWFLIVSIPDLCTLSFISILKYLKNKQDVV